MKAHGNKNVAYGFAFFGIILLLSSLWIVFMHTRQTNYCALSTTFKVLTEMEDYAHAYHAYISDYDIDISLLPLNSNINSVLTSHLVWNNPDDVPYFRARFFYYGVDGDSNVCLRNRTNLNGVTNLVWLDAWKTPYFVCLDDVHTSLTIWSFGSNRSNEFGYCDDIIKRCDNVGK